MEDENNLGKRQKTSSNRKPEKKLKENEFKLSLKFNMDEENQETVEQLDEKDNQQNINETELNSNIEEDEEGEIIDDEKNSKDLEKESCCSGVDNGNNNCLVKRERYWEERWVRIGNVWDASPDIFVKKWIRVSNPVAKPQIKSNKNISVKKDAPKTYKCTAPDCGKVFFDQNALKKHMIVHGERIYVCPVEGCNKKFQDMSKLRRHQLVHTGERKYKCEICGKRFSLDFNLRTHLRTHTGVKPFVCKFPSCGKKFTQSSNLAAHEKTHYIKGDIINREILEAQGVNMMNRELKGFRTDETGQIDEEEFENDENNELRDSEFGSDLKNMTKNENSEEDNLQDEDEDLENMLEDCSEALDEDLSDDKGSNRNIIGNNNTMDMNNYASSSSKHQPINNQLDQNDDKNPYNNTDNIQNTLELDSSDNNQIEQVASSSNYINKPSNIGAESRLLNKDTQNLGAKTESPTAKLTDSKLTGNIFNQYQIDLEGNSSANSNLQRDMLLASAIAEGKVEKGASDQILRVIREQKTPQSKGSPYPDI